MTQIREFTLFIAVFTEASNVSLHFCSGQSLSSQISQHSCEVKIVLGSFESTLHSDVHFFSLEIYFGSLLLSFFG